ncbi:hypothetical protein [Paraburkholderia sp. RAU2J]|uniref:hypothetical protein n=1 Tax=Paraburkholderia sp. RAU2J TaxID=1938810 RepID=UPI0018F332FB|nr:hypothetical protein [Paraburkholderia sp. RAU2J]
MPAIFLVVPLARFKQPEHGNRMVKRARLIFERRRLRAACSTSAAFSLGRIVHLRDSR